MSPGGQAVRGVPSNGVFLSCAPAEASLVIAATACSNVLALKSHMTSLHDARCGSHILHDCMAASCACASVVASSIT